MSVTLADIKDYWERSGCGYDTANQVTPTSRDPYLAMLEEDNIVSQLRREYNALEIGCGDASHTVKYASYVRSIIGVDVSSSLAKVAKERIESLKVNNANVVTSSMLDLDKLYCAGSYDCIISQRVLINLPTWSLQQEMITKVHRLLAPKGILLLTEGFQDELDNLNDVRERLGLSRIKVVDYNHNMRRTRFERFVSKFFVTVDTRHYGLYLLLSRTINPLVAIPDEPKHNSDINKAAMFLCCALGGLAVKKYSYNLFYALQKRLPSKRATKTL